MITNHQRYRQTDGRHAIPIPRICTKVHCAVKRVTEKATYLVCYLLGYLFNILCMLSGELGSDFVIKVDFICIVLIILFVQLHIVIVNASEEEYGV